MSLSAERRDAYLAECHYEALQQIRELVPTEGNAYDSLYRLVLDYPLRGGKALRPALCIAVCRALGGALDDVRRTAAVLELYHNAFLVHDDVEDESESRRGRPTLHLEHGVPIAINVGDAMLALSLEPLLDNVEVLGLGPSLRVLRSIANMSRESVEGQAIELDWIRSGTWKLSDADYIEMVVKKTGWYSFITPISLGAEAAGADGETRRGLEELGRRLAVAFQIQDDLLNLETSDAAGYGKEAAGDLWEGKRTLILLHTLRQLEEGDRSRCLEILSRPRPTAREAEERDAVLAALPHADLCSESQTKASAVFSEQWSRRRKGTEDIRFLRHCIDRCGSIEYARTAAAEWARRARCQMERCKQPLQPSVHLDFVESLVHYVHQRQL